jgi:iron complex outermembrane receptor protein
VRYLAEVPVNDTGSDTAPAYTVADASLGYAGRHAAGRWNAFVRVDNLFDRRYAGSVIVNDSNGRFFEPAPGRTFLVGFALDWSH